MARLRQRDETAGLRRLPPLAAAVLTAGLLLAGCNPLPYAKLVTDDMDKGFSLVTEEECDLQNIFAGKPYCQTRVVLRDDPPVYCYRTLGVPDCYARPDPYGVAQSSSGRQTPPMALGDAVPAAVEVAPNVSVQYGGGVAAPQAAVEVITMPAPPPGSGGGPQYLPPKTTLR